MYFSSKEFYNIMGNNNAVKIWEIIVGPKKKLKKSYISFRVIKGSWLRSDWP